MGHPSLQIGCSIPVNMSVFKGLTQHNLEPIIIINYTFPIGMV